MLRSPSTDKSSSSSDESTSASSSDADGDGETEMHDQYSLLEPFWAASQRPKHLQSREIINKMSMADISAMFSMKESLDKKNKGELTEAFVKDKKPPRVTYKTSDDDRNKILHPASFLRLPIRDFEKWWMKMPTTRSHIYTNFPKEFIGCSNIVSDVTERNLHDRKNVLSIKMFMAENVSVANKPMVKHTGPDGSMKTDFDWVNPYNISQVQEALATYTLIAHSVWPQDPTGMMMQKVLAKYRWFSACDNMTARVKALTAFINGVLRINAVRATNRNCIMSEKEMKELVSSTLASHGYNPAIPYEHFKPDSTQSSGQKGAATKTGNPKRQEKERVRAEHQGHGLCYAWNSTDGATCKNGIPNTDLCKDAKGRIFAHRCNMGTGRNSWCKQAHRRKDHK